ncbi:MAG: dihydropteroate synthase [Saprospiraceae bacterium]
MLYEQQTINCRGRLLDLSQPVVMAILNLTPDSFYDGGVYQSDNQVLSQVERFLSEGATIIDVGGMSSRPGAEIISSEEELQRVIPSIEQIIKRFPEAILSIDTLSSKVAKAAVESGARIVNDISAGRHDEDMIPLVGQLKTPYVAMHMQHTPKTMQEAPIYDDVCETVMRFLIERIDLCRKAGILDVIIDLGFGFGKTVEHNYELLRNMEAFKILEVPILAGLSRKSMICKPLKVNPKDALNGTTALHMVALQQGARILRVHDVREAMEVIKLWQLTKEPLKEVSEA